MGQLILETRVNCLSHGMYSDAAVLEVKLLLEKTIIRSWKYHSKHSIQIQGFCGASSSAFCFLAWPVISFDGADRVRSVYFRHLVYIDQRFRLHRRFGILGEPSPCPRRTLCTENVYPGMAAKKTQPLIYKGCGVVVTVGLEPTTPSM